MRYAKTLENQFVCYAASGRFTAQDSDVIKDLIHDIKGLELDRCVIDLTQLEFIDSSGIGMLLILNAEAAAKGKAFAMVVGSGQARKVIEMTQIRQIIPQFDSLDAYREAVEDQGKSA